MGPTYCTQDSDCKANEMCVYEFGSCSAQGQCEAPPPEPQCGTVESYCSCDGGSVVYGGCGFPNGYVSGPTTGYPDYTGAVPCGPASDSGGDDTGRTSDTGDGLTE